MNSNNKISISQLLNNEQNFISKHSLTLMLSIVTIITTGMYFINVPIYENVTIVVNNVEKGRNTFGVNKALMNDVINGGDTIKIVQEGGKLIPLICITQNDEMYVFKTDMDYLFEGKSEVNSKIYIRSENLIVSLLKSIVQE